MSKPKKDRTAKAMPVNIVLPSDISTDEMKHIIADGLMEFEERKKQQEKEAKELLLKERQRAVGIKDYSNVNGPKRWLLKFGNTIHVIWKTCFISGQYLNDTQITFSLMQMILYVTFKLLSLAMLCVSILFFIYPVCLCLGFLGTVSWVIVVTSLLLSLLTFLLFGLFRMASLEINNMKDRNYLLGLFSGVTSIATIIIAVATLLATQK